MAYFSITVVAMQGDEIREQIEALRQEVRGLSNSILNLRQDDMRKVFGDQIRPVLNERIIRYYSRPPKGMTREVGMTREDLLDIVDRSINIFQHDGRQKALEFIEGTKHNRDQGMDDRYRTNRFDLQIIAQIREYLELSDTIFNRTVSDGPIPQVGKEPIKEPLSPEAAERLLAPLANARRVQVLLVLSRESNSLAELCKVLDLQKGHLQFHLKALLEVDYIRFDRKSRLYSISPRGTMVLDGVARLLDDLSDGMVE
jgi:DNA-binding transcriptional ArsR family regulator